MRDCPVFVGSHETHCTWVKTNSIFQGVRFEVVCSSRKHSHFEPVRRPISAQIRRLWHKAFVTSHVATRTKLPVPMHGLLNPSRRRVESGSTVMFALYSSSSRKAGVSSFRTDQHSLFRRVVRHKRTSAPFPSSCASAASSNQFSAYQRVCLRSC